MVLARTALLGLALSACIAPALRAAETAPQPAASTAPDASLLGSWSGSYVPDPRAPAARAAVLISIVADKEGLALIDHEPRSTGYPPVPLHQTAPTRWQAEAPGMMGSTLYLLQVDHRHRKIGLEVRSSGTTARAPFATTLRRDNRATLAFQAPRISPAGERLLAYRYQAPRPGSGWPTSSPEVAGIDRDRIEAMVKAVLAQQAEPVVNRTDSIVLIRDGKLVLEEYFWGWTRDTLHPISSDTKSVTSMLTGIAVDRGLVRSDDLVAAAFAGDASLRWVRDGYRIRLRDMLSMTAGVEWNEALPYQDPRNAGTGLVAAPLPVAYVMQRPLTTPPGTHYEYNSGLPLVVGDMIARAAGQPLERFAKEALFKPLGITRYNWSRRIDGKVLAAGGMEMRPLDMAKLGTLMLQDGVWNGKRLLSADWIAQSTRQQTPAGDYAYGYYWHLGTADNKRLGRYTGYMAIGQAGQYIIVIPAEQLVAVVTSSNWQPGGTKVAMTEIIDKYLIPAIRPKSSR